MISPSTPQRLMFLYHVIIVIIFDLLAQPIQAKVANLFRVTIAGHVMTPQMSNTEYERVSWSSESLVLQKKNGGLIIYHNYTVTTEDGTQRTRWTKREYIPDRSPKRLGRRYMAMIEGTQYGSNKWPTKIGGRPVIPYCYENQDGKTQFRDIVEEAMDRWHTALGENAGTRFVLNCEEFCGNIVGARPVLNINILKDVNEGMHANSIGFGGYGTKDNALFTTLEQFSNQAKSEDDTQVFTHVSGMTYELGKRKALTSTSLLIIK